MFKDYRARRAWGIYFLKAEAVLAPLEAAVRRELIEDLKSHVTEILNHSTGDEDEFVRVTAALNRVGEPREFLAPLVADAIFRQPPKYRNFGVVFHAVALYATRGTSYLIRAIALTLVAALSAFLTIAAFNSLLRPDKAGIFRIGEDDIQVRILGLGGATGEQLLVPWISVLIIALGMAVLTWCAGRVKRILLQLIAEVV